MKNVLKRGFTLVELLVVVLIIGILSSVALPQYQKAVNKSRIAGYWPVLKNYAEALQRCALEKGYCYDSDQSNFDIEIPTCKPLPEFNGCSYYDSYSNGHDYTATLYFGSKQMGLMVTNQGRFCGDDRGGELCRKYGMSGAPGSGMSKSTIYALDSTSR